MDVIAYFLPVVFIDLHFERANCWSPIPSSPQRRELCSAIKSGCLRWKAFHFRARFGPQSQRNVASFLWSGSWFLPLRPNWMFLPLRNTGPSMTLYGEWDPLPAQQGMTMAIQTSCFNFQRMNTSRLPPVYPYNSLRPLSLPCLGLLEFQIHSKVTSPATGLPSHEVFLTPSFAEQTYFSSAF